MTSYIVRKASPEKIRADVVVVGLVDDAGTPRVAPGGEAVASAYGKSFGPLLATLGARGKTGEVLKVSTGGTLKSPLLVLVGLGSAERVDTATVRAAAGAAARVMSNVSSVALALPAADAEHVRAVLEGYRLGSYAYTRYKSAPDAETASEVIVLSDAAKTKAVAETVEAVDPVLRAVSLVRDWVNTPPGDLTPPAFADAVGAAVKDSKTKLKLTVLDEKTLEAGGYGGILGVGRGSDSPPRLVELTYSPRGAKAHLALVGKGITYDSGGLSIKPGGSMATMKMDMAGAASVVAATIAIAELGLPIKVTTLAPMAENMISGRATRPGDVLKMYGGKTVEVLNTDAEGRLILADALVKVAESKPDLIVDVATLTGACIVALGDRIAGLMGNDEELLSDLEAAAQRAGERVWPLPIPAEMTEKVRGNSLVADLAQHNAERWGGTLYAAAFLQEFAAGQRWAHLDIAGPAYNEKKPYGHIPTGGTGHSVATLVELARSLV
ncbi:leucyl aminopeptidase [Nocardioides massiliensis]|uniref:Probable cytosol aminopeptidase n=3 Tax=Nocardioides massiliensis TaxID=1325935 RepID=A0ABT9NTF3_9ACTN|nr:leucyl aminopeptidase [Nocardioides massiliensis]MDP9823606.1 leucyl aminopeptidase [Nocardioides massiliensis]